MSIRQIFEDWYFGENHTGKARERSENGEYRYLAAGAAWNTWQAATKAEREACARLFEDADGVVHERTAANWRDPARAIRMRSNLNSTTSTDA